MDTFVLGMNPFMGVETETQINRFSLKTITLFLVNWNEKLMKRTWYY